jgi:hypothetical protein
MLPARRRLGVRGVRERGGREAGGRRAGEAGVRGRVPEQRRVLVHVRDVLAEGRAWPRGEPVIKRWYASERAQ